MSALPMPNPFAALAAFALEPFGRTEAEQRATLEDLAGLKTPLPTSMLIAALPAATTPEAREEIIVQLEPRQEFGR